MRYLFQFLRILLFCFLGELCAFLLPFPIPANIYGLLLLLFALRATQFKLEQVRETGMFLTGLFPLLFVPSAVGTMEYWSELKNMLLPALIAIIPVTLLVMAVSGIVTQKLSEKSEEKKHG